MKTSKKVLAALLAICLNTGTALAEVDKTATTALVADVTSGIRLRCRKLLHCRRVRTGLVLIRVQSR